MMPRSAVEKKTLPAVLFSILLVSASGCGGNETVQIPLDGGGVEVGTDLPRTDQGGVSEQDLAAAELRIDDLVARDLEPDKDVSTDSVSPTDTVENDGGQTSVLEPLAEVLMANPGAFARKSVPVSRSVPLTADAEVLSIDELFLESEAGTLVAAGFTPVARWGGPTDDEAKPLKWVLVEFVTDIGSQQEKTFTIMRGTAPRPEPTIFVEQTSGHLVQTGPCDFVVGPEDGGLLIEANCGGEGFPAPPLSPNMVLTLADGAELTLADFAPDSVEITRHTDVSVAVEIAGKLGEQNGWKRPLTYTATLTFFGGTGLVNMLVRIENRNKAVHPGNIWLLGSDGSIFFEDLTLRFPFGDGGTSDFHVMGDDQSWTTGEAADLVLYQDSSGGKKWNSYNHVNHAGDVKVSFKGYKSFVAGQEAGSGLRADGSLVVESGTKAMGATVRHFWQNFPKALRYSEGTLDVSLFPTEFDDLFELQGGEYKTHEVVLAFATGDGASSDVKAALRGVHTPLIIRNTAKYYCSTGAMLYDLAPRKTFIQDDWEDTVDHVVLNTGPTGRSMITQREAIDEYGWRNFGEAMADHETDCGNQSYNVPISHDNNQYDGTSIGFIHHARTDNMPEWFAFAEEYARHYLDIDVYHTLDDVEVYNGGVFAHTTHDSNAGRSTHRTYPENAETQGCTQYQSGGPALDYIHLDGLVLYHYFSGYPFVLDVIREVADWTITRMNGKFAGMSQRQYSNCLRTMYTAYRLFHEQKYLDTAHELVAVAASYADSFSGTDWAGAMVGKALGRYLDFQQEYGLQDASTQQALDSLFSMADLALENHNKTDVQAYRFSEMWLYAYKHSTADNPNRDAYKEKAFATHEATAENYWNKGDYSTQKEMTVLSTNGNMYYYFKNLE